MATHLHFYSSICGLVNDDFRFVFVFEKIALPYAWYLSLFFGFNLSGLMITAQIASEPPTILCLLMTLYACFLAHRSQKHLFWNSIAFLMLCCATLIRPQTQYLILFLAIYACWCAFKVSNRYFLKQFLLITCLFCTTIGYQLFQMKQIHHHSALSIIPNYACYVYLSAYAEVIDISNKNVRDSTWQTIEMARWRELNEISKQKNAGYAAQYAHQHFLEKLDSQPLRIFKTWIRDIISNSAAYCGNLPDGTGTINSDSIIISILKIWTRLYNLIYSGFILIIIPIMILIRNKKLKINSLWVVSWLVCLYCILTAGVSFAQGDRFHLIFFPIAIICFASFCDNLKIKV
jgi:hypothetical protein